MPSKALAALFVALFAVTVAVAQETKLSVGKDDTIRSVLSAQTGKRVTVKLDSGDEMTGVLRSVGDKVVHIGELAGKEYFDAIIDLDEVAAVVLRVR